MLNTMYHRDNMILRQQMKAQMNTYRIHDEVTKIDHWVIAPGPATGLNIVAKNEGLNINQLLAYDRHGNFQGRWAA